MGTDSTAINDDDDLLQEMRLVSKLHRQPGIGAPAITVDQVLAMATANAAVPTGFAGDIGVLEPGRRADLALIRLDGLESPYLDPDTPPLEVVMGRARSGDVAAVIVDGEVLLQNGQHQRVNQDDVARELRDNCPGPWNPRRWPPAGWQGGFRPTSSGSTRACRPPVDRHRPVLPITFSTAAPDTRTPRPRG